MNSYKIESNDCSLQVYAKGKLCACAMIFLHGGPGSGAEPLFSLSSFQAFEDAYLCIHFDQRGSGESIYDLRKGLSIEQICQDVKRVIQDTIQRYNCEHIFLWGGSYGGTLACLYMEHDGEGVDGVILNNPAITFSRAQGISFYERMKQSMLHRMPKDMQPTNDTNLTPEMELHAETFQQFVFSKYNPSNSLRHICAMSEWFFSTTFEETLAHISVPTQLMLGKEDFICENENTIKVVQMIHNPMIELHVLSPCGHAIFEDQKEDFVSISKTFMENILRK